SVARTGGGRRGRSTAFRYPAEEDALAEPVIPYETPPDRRSLTARELFGVVVRTFGLVMVLWGLYTLTYLVNDGAVYARTAVHARHVVDFQGCFVLIITFSFVSSLRMHAVIITLTGLPALLKRVAIDLISGL